MIPAFLHWRFRLLRGAGRKRETYIGEPMTSVQKDLNSDFGILHQRDAHVIGVRHQADSCCGRGNLSSPS